MTATGFEYLILKTQYLLSIARFNLLEAIFVMLKILRLLFTARIDLFNIDVSLPGKSKQQQRKPMLGL